MSVRARLVRGLIGFVLTCVFAAPASAQEQIEYYGLDHLGSVRVIFDQNGTVIDRMDYGPFGENLRAAIRFPAEQFAQLARDAETGQDHAQARNYAPRTGRFNRVDPVYAGLFNPQGWNRYVYATNSPVTFLDPAGLDPFRITSVPACSTFDCGALDYFYPPVYGETPIWFVARAPIFGGPGRTPNPPGTPDDPTTPDNPPGPDPGPGPGPGPGPTEGNVEIFKACVAGAGAFVDGVVPWTDPLSNRGVYDPGRPGISFSQDSGEFVRDFALSTLGAGAILGRAASWLGTAGRSGNTLAKTISSGNRYARLGLSNMGGVTKTPALRFGSATSDLGKSLTHVDLRLTQVFSQTGPAAVKALKGCLR